VSRRPTDRDGADGEGQYTLARRPLLLGAGAVGAALALGACSSPPPSPYSGEVRFYALAAALENQAVWFYRTALSNASSGGKLGKLPTAFTSFAQTAIAHHTDHAGTWNAMLRKAKKPPISGTPLTLQPSVSSALGSATTLAQVATYASQLENQVAQTLAGALGSGTITGASAISTAASIAPVEAMHATVLQFIAGKYPVPDDFVGTNAVLTSELTA
jgi:hypothetical protein